MAEASPSKRVSVSLSINITTLGSSQISCISLSTDCVASECQPLDSSLHVQRVHLMSYLVN